MSVGPHPASRYADRVIERGQLPDGTVVWIGPLLPGDREQLAQEYETLSDTSKRHRFLSAVAHLTPWLLDQLVDGVDGIDHIALVLFIDHGELIPAAIGRVIRYPDLPETADVAITVKEEWRLRGVAGTLMPRLVAHRPAGVTRLLTEVDADNPAPVKLLRRLGPTQVRVGADGVLDVEVDVSDAARS